MQTGSEISVHLPLHITVHVKFDDMVVMDVGGVTESYV